MKTKTSIRRYKASFPLQTVFVTNADGSGDHIFTQLKREGNVCLYSRTKVENNRPMGYEVITTKTVKAGTVYAKGAKPTEKDTESYPGGESFGKTAWFFLNKKLAEKRFSALVKGINQTKPIPTDEPVVTSVVKTVPTVVVKSNEKNYVIPDGEFSQAGFAMANGFPVRGVVYNVLHTLLLKGFVKESRRTKMGAGRPTTFFAKA